MARNAHDLGPLLASPLASLPVSSRVHPQLPYHYHHHHHHFSYATSGMLKLHGGGCAGGFEVRDEAHQWYVWYLSPPVTVCVPPVFVVMSVHASVEQPHSWFVRVPELPMSNQKPRELGSTAMHRL